MSDDSIPRSILLLILLILCGGFFAGSETAFSYCNRIRLKRKAEDGEKRAKRVLGILDQFDALLTTILIGTNVCYVTASSLATVLFVRLLGSARGSAVSTVVVTLCVFFFAETIPKNVARVNSDAYASAASLPIRLIMTVLKPITFFFSGISKLIKRLIGAQTAPTMTEDEFAAVIEDVQEDGLLEPEEGKLIQSAIEFSDKRAVEIMTPLANMVGVEISESPEHIRELVLQQKYSRIPLYRDTPDNVVGVVRSRDLLFSLMHGEALNLARYITPPYMISPEMKLDQLFEGLGRRRTHIAFVLGQNGVQGFLTMEDILEELAGEIYDEDDVSTADSEKEARS